MHSGDPVVYCTVDSLDLQRLYTEILQPDSTKVGCSFTFDAHCICGHDAEALLKDLSETSLLLRALSYLQYMAQDVRLATNIDLCMQTIHPEHLDLMVSMTSDVHMLTTFCIFSSFCLGHDSVPELSLLPAPDWIGDSSNHSAATSIRLSLGCRAIEGGPSIVTRFEFPATKQGHIVTSLTRSVHRRHKDVNLVCSYLLTHLKKLTKYLPSW